MTSSWVAGHFKIVEDAMPGAAIGLGLDHAVMAWTYTQLQVTI